MTEKYTNFQKDMKCLQGQDSSLYKKLEEQLTEKEPQLSELWTLLEMIENKPENDMNMEQIIKGLSTTRSGLVYNSMGGNKKKKIFRGGANKWLVRTLVWLTISLATGAAITTIYITAQKLGVIKILEKAVDIADFTVQGCGSAEGIAGRNTASSWLSYFSSNATPDITCSNAVLKLENAQNALNAEMNKWIERAFGASFMSGGLLTTQYSQLYTIIDTSINKMVKSGNLVENADGTLETVCQIKKGQGRKKSISSSNIKKNKKTVNKKNRKLKNNKKSKNIKKL